MAVKKKQSELKKYIDKKVSSKNKEFAVAFNEAKIHLKIASLIEELRIKAELTQAALAKKAGVSQPMIARLERGDQDRVPTLSTINKVFKALGYEVDLNIREAS